MPGTLPSGVASPASAAMPVTVPIVSKKSLSMIAKIVSSADTTPSFANTWNGSWSPSPRVEKLTTAVSLLVSTGCTPATIAMIVVTAMLMISAARILRAYRMKVIARPIRNTNCAGDDGNARVTSVPCRRTRAWPSPARSRTGRGRRSRTR